MRRRASPLGVFALAAIIAAVAVFLLPGQRRAPDVNLILLSGRATTLAELRGRPVLVAFWATSCAPCVEETPDLIRLYRELNPRGFELVAVAMPYDPPLYVQNFVREHQVPYPVALDVAGNVLRAFGDITVVPTAYLIDAKGIVVLKHVGRLDIERVRRLAAPYLTAPSPPAVPSTT